MLSVAFTTGSTAMASEPAEPDRAASRVEQAFDRVLAEIVEFGKRNGVAPALTISLVASTMAAGAMQAIYMTSNESRYRSATGMVLWSAYGLAACILGFRSSRALYRL